MTRQQAHDFVSERHRHWLDNVKIKVDTSNGIEADRYVPNRVDNFDHKSWWKSVAVFWAIVFGIGMLAAVVKYATACDEVGEPETVKIKIVRGI